MGGAELKGLPEWSTSSKCPTHTFPSESAAGFLPLTSEKPEGPTQFRAGSHGHEK